jgi:soluble lytic murein transglycosylase-like protein
MATVLGGLLLPQFTPYDAQRTTINAINAAGGMVNTQTSLLALQEAQRQQEAQALAYQHFQQNPGSILGGSGPMGSAPAMPGGGPMMQQAFGPGGVGPTQQVPGGQDLSRFAGVSPQGGGPLPAGVGMPTVTPPGGGPVLAGGGQANSLEALMRQNPRAAFIVQQQQQAQEDRQWKIQEQQLTMREKVAGYLTRRSQGVKNQDDLEALRQDLQRSGLTQYAARLPQVYSKEAMDTLSASGQSMLENAQTTLAQAQAAHAEQKARTEQYNREVFLPQVLSEDQAPRGGAPPPGTNGTAAPGRQVSAPAEVETAVQEAVSRYPRVRAEIARAIIAQESNFDRTAVSPKGAQGYMQLMPAAQREMGVKDPFDTRQNILGGVGYFDKLLTKYDGDEAKALAAYNAGPGRVDAVKGDLKALPQETQDYVPKVLQRAQVGETARGPATGPQAQRLEAQIADLTRKREQYAKAAAVKPELHTYVDTLTRQIDDVRKERDRLEEIPRAVQKETEITRAKTGLERERQAQSMLPEERRKWFTGLRTDIRQEPTFKLYQDVRNGYQNVRIGAESDSAQGDLAITNGMAKILDPTGSVLTGEARNIEEAQGQLQRWFNSPQKFFEGDRLTPENRQRFLKLAHAVTKEKLTTAQTELRTIYGPLAKEGNIDFEQLVPLPDMKPLGAGPNVGKFEKLVAP